MTGFTQLSSTAARFARQDAYHAELAALRRRNEELEEEVRLLRQSPDTARHYPWRLSPRLRRLLDALIAVPAGSFLTKEGAYRALYGLDGDQLEKGVDVAICKLRQRLRCDDIVIELVWGAGYRVAAESRAKIEAAIAAAR